MQPVTSLGKVKMNSTGWQKPPPTEAPADLKKMHVILIIPAVSKVSNKFNPTNMK